LSDLLQGVPKSVIATRFHAGLIQGVMQVVDRLAQRLEFDTVVLSGGCMQNAILLEGLEQALQQRQLNCYTHALVPANDGGIALGQAVICAANLLDPAPPLH
jgi:hydrogenase maturation protein HypF